MKTMHFLLLCLLLFPSISQAEAVQSPVMQYWTQIVEPGDFKKSLDAFCGGPKHDWPAIFSETYSSSLEEPVAREQARFRKLSDTLVCGLETYEAMMRTNALPAFVRQSGDLLTMRHQLERSLSYVNLVLIDSINRVLFVNLAERMIAPDTLSPDLVRLAEQLGHFHPDLEQIRVIAEKETRRSLVAREKFTGTDKERLRLLWYALEPDTTPMFPKNVLLMGTYTLLKTQDVPVLLNRLTMSDYYIRSALPALVAYRQKAEAYSSTNDHQQIKSIMGQDTKVSQSVGAEISGTKYAASVVNDLLHDAKVGRTRKLLLFSLPSVGSSK